VKIVIINLQDARISKSTCHFIMPR
jgi:hypothetical protein